MLGCKLRLNSFLLAVIIAGIFTPPSFATDKQYVILDVEGIGQDRSSAIENAWLEGITQAVGSFIDAKTELNNDKIAEKIIAYSRGVVERYEITGVDDSRANEGIYKINMRVWIVQDLLKDGAKHVSSGGYEVDFSPADLRKKHEELNAKKLEVRNASSETAKKKSQTGAQLLEATLNRYNSEDFLSCYIAGKPEPLKDKPDVYTLNVYVNFNEKLYNEAFIPDLVQVLDQIASVKKNTTLIKYKNELRDIASKKIIASSQSSIIAKALDGENDYLLALYNKPERFGVRLYGFNDEDSSEVIAILSRFKERTNRVAGVLLELLDEDKEAIDSIQEKFHIDFLISAASPNAWAIHPTILFGDYENKILQGVITFEMPEEIIPFVKSIRALLLLATPEELAGQKQQKQNQEKLLEEERKIAASLVKFGINRVTQTSNGIIITDVNKNSPTYEQGIREGDLLSEINGQEVRNTKDIAKVVGNNSSIILMVERDNTTYFMQLNAISGN